VERVTNVGAAEQVSYRPRRYPTADGGGERLRETIERLGLL